MGKLFVVSTPIGNLEDITLRAVRVLREVSLIAAEDTRVTRRLLDEYQITTPMVSFHEHSGSARLASLLNRLAAEDIALVSDAGTPGINDPGYPIISAAIQRGFDVVPIPGPSSLLAALVASGLPMHSFCFLGFAPRKMGARRKLLLGLEHADYTTMLLESPHRLLKTLDDIEVVLGPSRRIAIGRELTKKFEEIIRGTVAQARERFTTGVVRGEITIVIGPAAAGASGTVDVDRACSENR